MAERDDKPSNPAVTRFALAMMSLVARLVAHLAAVFALGAVEALDPELSAFAFLLRFNVTLHPSSSSLSNFSDSR